jgi:hypothetical protein
MFLKLTLTFGAASGATSHNILCEVAEKSLEIFIQDRLLRSDFIIVDELYRHFNAPDGTTYLTRENEIIVNTAMVGKVKEFSRAEMAWPIKERPS